MYRTIIGTQVSSQKQALDYDIDYVNNHCIVLKNDRYILYKLDDINYLIPLIYGMYKIPDIKYPAYVSKDKLTGKLTLLSTDSMVESFKKFIKTH